MPSSASPRKGAPKPAPNVRRPAPDVGVAPGSLQWLRTLLARPVGLVRRGNDDPSALLERRRDPPGPASMSQLRAELRALLSTEALGAAAPAMRHLLFLHQTLTRRGWSGVEALPCEVIGRARVQVDMLASAHPTPSLTYFIDRLGTLHATAQARADRHAHPDAAGGALEVTEATHEEFEAMERSWAGTSPPGMDPPAERDA
jgi:hypothetical protein